MIWATLDHGVRSVVREYQLNVYNAFATALDSIWRHGGKKAKLGKLPLVAGRYCD